MRRLELDIFYLSTRAATLFLLPLFISDTAIYLQYGEMFLQGGMIPYRSWDFEYPPLAYPFMLGPVWLQGLLGLQGPESYRLLFGFLLLPFDGLIYWKIRGRPSFPGAAFSYVLLSSALGLLLFDRFDIVLGFLFVWPFLGTNASDLRCALSWGLGGALKLVTLVPAPLAPFFWAESVVSAAFWKRFLRYGALAGLPLVVACGLALYLSSGKVSFLTYHSERGVQVESLVGSLVIAAHHFFRLGNLEVANNFGAQHLNGSVTSVAVPLSHGIFWASLGFTYLLLWWKRGLCTLLTASWLAVSAFVTFGYVLSPQFLLWLLPLGICAAGEVRAGRRGIWLGIFGLVVVLTGVHFRFYWSYVNMNSLSIAMVLARNFLLVALWFLSWRWMTRDLPGGRA
ncbi:MAG TPA: hypothetical protein VIH99_09615 [Bdellovibrionota bacterium]